MGEKSRPLELSQGQREALEKLILGIEHQLYVNGYGSYVYTFNPELAAILMDIGIELTTSENQTIRDLGSREVLSQGQTVYRIHSIDISRIADTLGHKYEELIEFKPFEQLPDSELPPTES